MERSINLKDLDEEQSLFGSRDHWRRVLARRFGVEMVSRNGVLKVIGEDAGVTGAADLLEEGLSALRESHDPRCLDRIFGVTGKEDGETRKKEGLASGIKARTDGQQRYVESLAKNTITIVSGPAGTGKTFLAVASAVGALRRGQFNRLVLARPAVEAGESLGFLPGDLQAKVNPYLRPLYDALFSMLDVQRVERYMETDVIEICPLAYMRGRTLDKAFIILDEAQNTTQKQMKMFLTRMGEGSQIVVTGDATQTDLPRGTPSGLVHAMNVLPGIEGIGIVELGKRDIVRHPLVQRIVDAYERDDDANGPSTPPRSNGSAAS